MAEISSNSKRIAKNTMALYIRMLLSTVVSLYTSRVVLQNLGVEDYGVYGVVGGIVAMFSFLNSTMAGATSRFMSFELGKGKEGRLRETFSAALTIHIGIALIVLVLSETIGLWFLCNKLVIPEGRMAAAHWVFQFSILSMVVSVTQVPYNAMIISHEKMDVYAYVEMLHVFLKLGIVYLLVIGNFDKLILYAFLVLVVHIITAGIYRIYCVRQYHESHYQSKVDKEIAKGIMSFSIYNLLGNLGAVFNLQGTSFVINMFFGVIYNAAASIALTVSGIVTGFASNIMTAFRPQIIKSYAENDIEKFQSLLLWAIKSILLVYSFVAVPAGFAIKEALSIWLIEVPEYADVFCRLLLISIFFETFRYIIIMGIHATGKVKAVSICSGIAFIVNPLVVYYLFRNSYPASYAYITVIGVNIILSFINIFVLKHNENHISIRIILLTITKVIMILSIVILLVNLVCLYKTGQSLIDIIIISGFSCILLSLLGYFCILNNTQRTMLKQFIVTKCNKKLKKY